MAIKLETGVNYFDDFANGQGAGATNYFNYAVEISSDASDFTAASHADIDNDTDPQYWEARATAVLNNENSVHQSK